MRVENFISTGNMLTIVLLIGGFVFQWGITSEKIDGLQKQVANRPTSDSFVALVARVERLERTDAERSKSVDDLRNEIAKVSAAQQIQTVLIQGVAAQITDIKESTKARLKP